MSARRPLVRREILPKSEPLTGVLVVVARCGFCANPWFSRPCPLVHAQIVVHKAVMS